METNIDIISFDNKNEEAGHHVCNCFGKKKKRIPNVGFSLKVCFCWLIEIQRDGTKTLSFPRSNGKTVLQKCRDETSLQAKYDLLANRQRLHLKV